MIGSKKYYCTEDNYMFDLRDAFGIAFQSIISHTDYTVFEVVCILCVSKLAKSKMLGKCVNCEENFSHWYYVLNAFFPQAK